MPATKPKYHIDRRTPRWRTLVKVILPDGKVLYLGKLIDSRCRPDDMSFDALSNAFGSQGETGGPFSWTTHPRSRNSIPEASRDLEEWQSRAAVGSVKIDLVELEVNVAGGMTKPLALTR